jgi:multiple sugar transport system ATP-binding protein
VYVTHDQTEAMTLGDRLAVMRDGVLQQVGTPDELYNRPRNLFVAGFIGSPGMNFLPGEIGDGSLRFPLATVPLAGADRAGLTSPAREGPVVVGIRPEDFEDAALTGERERGMVVKAVIDVLESTGSDVYAHLSLDGHNGTAVLGEPALRELAAAAVSTAEEAVASNALDVIARLDSSSELGEGKEGELWLDTSKLHFFDPASGERLES